MPTSQLRRVIQTLHAATFPAEEAELTDGQLLESYVRGREEAAFAALVQRHGPVGLGGRPPGPPSHPDAEDPFPAPLPVLVRKAAPLGPVANRLLRVAHQTALKARAMAPKRSARERQVTVMPEPAL